MKLWKVKTHIVAREFFQYSLITYLILLLAETVRQGIVSYFFNLNILLALVLTSGVIMVLTHQEQLDKHLHPEKKHKVRKRDVLYLFVLALGGGFLVLYKTTDLGMLAILIGLLAALIIFLLGILVLTDKE